MKVRRCAVVYFERREVRRFDLASLLSGGNGLVREMSWVAMAPHLASEVTISEEELLVIGRYGPTDWVVLDTPMDALLFRLIEQGLLLTDALEGSESEKADARFRALNWWPLAAMAHWAARWNETNSVEAMQRLGTDNVEGLLRCHGPPPPATIDRQAAGLDVSLERASPGDLDHLMSKRATCRNFDSKRPLEHALLSRVLERVFAAQGRASQGVGVEFLKKHTPSGGSLHATEAYLIVQRVEGIAAGLYHYRPIDHSLRPLPGPALPLSEFARSALAGQYWFSEAPVLVVYAPRVARSHWKYQNHPKAYRALTLDVGHLSQTLYLSATDLGLGAFVTAAINEMQLEQAFGLGGLEEGPIAVGGFGWRAAEQDVAEFDPAGAIW